MIAVDGMGGDFAPAAVVAGVVDAAAAGVPVLLTGPSARLRAELNSYRPDWEALPISLKESPDIISMHDEPVRAVRQKRDSSLVAAVRAVKNNEALSVISAGNSGALMAAALFELGRTPGVERPAIAGFLPTMGAHPVLALDLGANISLTPAHIRAFVDLGVAHLATHRPEVTCPRVAILSNGIEEKKGTALIQRAAALIRQDQLEGTYLFIGQREPQAILSGDADIVVTDGFTGNILLKTLEGALALATALAPKNSLDSALAYGQAGAKLLGVAGCVIVLHGAADRVAIKRAVIAAAKNIRAGASGASREGERDEQPSTKST